MLRVRLLAYIKNDIIGDFNEKVFNCVPVREIPIPYVHPDGEPPAAWWSELADKSLLVGVYKHGYDRYNLMRQDPALCFLTCCGPPDGDALLAEIRSNDDDLVKNLDDDEEAETPATPAVDADLSTKDDSSQGTEGVGAEDRSKEKHAKDDKAELSYLPFPNPTDMNNRLRRLVTSYQRKFKKEEMRNAQKVRHMQRLERMEKFEAAVKEREIKKRDQAQKYVFRRYQLAILITILILQEMVKEGRVRLLSCHFIVWCRIQ